MIHVNQIALFKPETPTKLHKLISKAIEGFNPTSLYGKHQLIFCPLILLDLYSLQNKEGESFLFFLLFSQFLCDKQLCGRSGKNGVGGDDEGNFNLI